MYYTGIGSRKTPKSYKKDITSLVQYLEKNNFILRSGGAEGADTFFEESIKNNKEIYIPWKGFNKSDSELYKIPNWSFKLAEEIYNKYEEDRIDSGQLKEFRFLKNPIKRLFARNMCQVLGQDDRNEDNYSKFVICYTSNGLAIGGTRLAIWCALEYDIPIINMYDNDWKQQINKVIKEHIK